MNRGTARPFAVATYRPQRDWFSRWLSLGLTEEVTLMEGVALRSEAALNAFLGGLPDKPQSPATAQALAMAAFQVPVQHDRASQAFGLGQVAADASHLHLAIQTARLTEVWSLPANQQAGASVADSLPAALGLIASACQIELAEAELGALPQPEQVARKEAPPEWTELLLGRRDKVLAQATANATPNRVLFPGSFNPPHVGHREMAEYAGRRLGAGVAYELSVENVDKPPLDFVEVDSRLARLSGSPVWLTRAPTFVEKAALFPGATFVVGIDTILRIADPKYYGGDPQRRSMAIRDLADRGCDFLVFGRNVEGHFWTLNDVTLPAELEKVCHAVPEDEFRRDVSSTKLRREGEA